MHKRGQGHRALTVCPVQGNNTPGGAEPLRDMGPFYCLALSEKHSCSINLLLKFIEKHCSQRESAIQELGLSLKSNSKNTCAAHVLGS